MTRIVNFQNILQLIFISFIALIANNIYGIATATFLIILSLLFLIYKNYINQRKLKITSLLTRNNQKSKKQKLQTILQKSLFHSSLANLPLIAITLLILTANFLIIRTNVSLTAIIEGMPIAKELTGGLLNPNWNLLEDASTVYARQTVEVALLGTIVAFFISLPISFFCSWNLMDKNIVTKSIYYLVRSFMVVIRAIPTFLLGLIFVALVGLGSFPGVLAIIIFSTGIMVKLFSESIESINSQTMQAVSASGGNMLHVIIFAVIPQSLPMIIAQTLYCTEINVHSATVLGLVGAEGIGLPIHEYLSMLAYSNAATFIFVTIIMTLVIDFISVFSRKRILSKIN